MSGYTFAEKVLARAAGMDTVRAGETIDVTPQVIFSHDNTAAIRRIFLETGAKHIVYPERVVVTLDHAVPAPTTQHAQNHAEIRAWVREQGIENFFDVGRGICHQVISEEALVLPGEVILGSDSHSTHFGWLGAFGMGVGRTEMAALWATGNLWITVPKSIRLTLTGKPPVGVTAKDIALHILRCWGADGGQYRALEFTGDTLDYLSVDDRAVLTNMMAEFGVMNAYMPPNEHVFSYIDSKVQRAYDAIYPDIDAVYDADYMLDVTGLNPVVAVPDSPDNVVSLDAIQGQEVHQAFLGTCTNGRYEDLEAAAQVLAGHRISIRMIVIPASAEVLRRATETGVLRTLIEAGATIGTSGCGPCMGNHMGVPAPNEVTISTGNRNFRGRMGTQSAPVYLSNPYVVAASAITGRISNPEEFLS